MRRTRRLAIPPVARLLATTDLSGPARAAPEEQITWGVQVTLAPTRLDPALAAGGAYVCGSIRTSTACSNSSRLSPTSPQRSRLVNEKACSSIRPKPDAK